MNYEKIFSKLKSEWKEKISEDEWYFSTFKESFTSQLESYECIDAINFLTNYLLTEKDSPYFVELTDLFLLLVRKANTTELPKELEKNKTKIESLFAKDDYTKKIWEEIKILYLLDL